ncbi:MULTISPECIES: hypothetical protein [unclassified Granulicatella]|uniref:hypothetical protein n=1 Tax=unclassified Granulicatella TaxID=2630493 RepID=UPI0010743E8B|nr:MULTISPECIES: hypothetical protein [unclassified Granulicatella]MBF0781092.1 hypothetical protein [Granulicatella sp. 19428wC4_WM01]TFU92137.1 hypothetical protein E4T68_08265 [Granulicatella sp. WM01]
MKTLNIIVIDAWEARCNFVTSAEGLDFFGGDFYFFIDEFSPCSMREKIGLEEYIKKIFIKALDDYYSTGFKNEKVTIKNTPEGEEYIYSAEIDCIILLPDFPNYRFKFRGKIERFLDEEILREYAFYDFDYFIGLLKE